MTAPHEIVQFIYVCPECGLHCSQNTLMHQHANGEWVATETVRAYYQLQRWRNGAAPADIAEATGEVEP